jgi:hypothetical protein
MFCTTIMKTLNDTLIGTMDCMYDQEASKTCRNQSDCQMKYTRGEKDFSHCCCDKDFCNLNFTL